MEVQQFKPSELKMNPNNPRVIRDHKFKKLVKSIQDFPQMLQTRPIVVNSDLIVLGGNMRLKAVLEAKLKKVPVIVVDEWSESQQREFIIKDNLGYGEWDWEMIANEWDAQELDEWGLDIINVDSNVNLDDFFEDKSEDNVDSQFKIVLDYTEDDYNEVIELFKKHSGSREAIVMKLLQG
jgi:ParB-like chromosome segregation protein Spo0J